MRYLGLLVRMCIVLVLCGVLVSCQKEVTRVQYKKWTVGKPLLTAGEKDSFDNVAVKDPSIIYFNGSYHLFYTAKSSYMEDGKQKFGISTGYVTAPRLEDLNHAKRYDFKDIVGEIIIAPQVFYFEPQKKWYLFGHKNGINNRNLIPIYMTNTNIEDVNGWTRPQVLKTRKDFWIDFWVICDDEKAHLFYTDQLGSVLRVECPMEEFPEGFAKAQENVALTIKGEDDYGPWRVFEAEHVYHVKKTNRYLLLVEGGYGILNRGKLVDARRRFMIALTADELEGPWYRVEKGVNEYFACARALYNPDGSKSAYTQVSHPELIRSGYDQKLEIEDYNISMLMQAFDGSEIPDDYQYSGLPWELSLIRNY